MDFDYQLEEPPEILSSFRSAIGIAPNQGRSVEVINESSILYTSGTSLVIHNSAINKRDFVRNEESWFRVLATALDAQKVYCAVIALSAKPSTAKRVRRSSVIQRRGSVFGLDEGEDKSNSSHKNAAGRSVVHVPVSVALVYLPTMQIESQVQLAKSYFLDPTTIQCACFSQDGKVLCIGNGAPENKVIVVDPRSSELLFTFTNDAQILDLVFTVEKRFKQSEVYALLTLSASKLQSFKQEDKRTTFTVSKLLAQNKAGKFSCISNCFKGEYFAVGSKEGHIGIYSYTSPGKGNNELKRLSLNGKTPYCITVLRNGNYLLVGCGKGEVLIYEDYHSIAAVGHKKTRLGESETVNFLFKLKGSVNLLPIGYSPVVKIMLDLSNSSTVAVGEKNQIAGYTTQTLLSGKLSSATLENDYGEVSDIQRELFSQTEKANNICSSHFGRILNMDTCESRGLIATCSTDHTVRIWDLETFDCVVMTHFPSKQDIEDGYNVEAQSQMVLGPPEYVSFHPQGYHIAVCHDESLSLFYILHNRLELMHTFPVSHCFKAIISSGGNLIAAITGNTIEVFQMSPPYSHFVKLKGHLGNVSNLCWSKDDLRIASTCVRGSVLTWDVNPQYKNKSERITRCKPEEYIKKIDSFTGVAIDDVEPIPKARSVVAVSFDGSLQFISGGNVQHRLHTKALDGDRATVVHMSSVTMHYESEFTKDLRMEAKDSKSNLIDRPKVGVLLVGTNTGNVIAFTNWRRLQKNQNAKDVLEESLMTNTQRHIFPHCHSEPVVAISTMEGENNEFNTVISCCANGNICVSYMALQEGMEEEFRITQRNIKSKLFTETESGIHFVLVPSKLIQDFDAEIKQFKVRVEELTTEVDYQRERSAKQQRDTLKLFQEKEGNLVTAYKNKTLDLEQALEKAGKTTDVKVKALQLKQEEVVATLEEKFESKLHRELEISHTLRQEAEDTTRKHQEQTLRLKNNLQGKCDAMESLMNERVSMLEKEKQELYESKLESEHLADEFLFETELNYDADLELELKRTLNLEKELREKIAAANLEARMHKRRYDELIEKLDREKKEDHDHAAEKERLEMKIEELEKECLKFEDLIAEREDQLKDKEIENESLQRDKGDFEKQIFLHQELEKDLKKRFEPIKEKLEVMDERILLQDNEVEKQFNKLRGQKVQIDDKDRLIRTLRSELNKALTRGRHLAAKLERSEEQQDATLQKQKPKGPTSSNQIRQRPTSSPVYSTKARASLDANKQRNLHLVMDDEEADNRKLTHEIQRQRSIMEKASTTFLRRANYFEEKVTEISEQRMVENRELLDENIKLRKRLKETQRQLAIMETEALQNVTLKEPNDNRKGTDVQRPKSAMARSAGGRLIKGSTSRLIKSVSVADKEKIQKLNQELQKTRRKSNEQGAEINRLTNMVNTYRDEKYVTSRSLRPTSAPPKRRWI